jgi:nitrogen regulatory protein P-II 1
VKTILAVIRPQKLNAVRESLQQVEVTRMTVADALGYADVPKPGEEHLQWNLAQRVVVTIVVNDDFLERTLSMVTQAARTGTHGEPGDGKILVLPHLETIQIDSGARGPGAV